MWFSYVSKWLWNIHHHQNAEKKFFQKQIWFRNGASITAWNTSRYPPFHSVWKLQKCRISISEFGIFQQVLSAKIDLSGVTLFDRKIQVFKKSPKLTFFWHFLWTFVHSKCKRSSLRSQCWMRLFLWFSNTVWVWLGSNHFWRAQSPAQENGRH